MCPAAVEAFLSFLPRQSFTTETRPAEVTSNNPTSCGSINSRRKVEQDASYPWIPTPDAFWISRTITITWNLTDKNLRVDRRESENIFT